MMRHFQLGTGPAPRRAPLISAFQRINSRPANSLGSDDNINCRYFISACGPKWAFSLFVYMRGSIVDTFELSPAMFACCVSSGSGLVTRAFCVFQMSVKNRFMFYAVRLSRFLIFFMSFFVCRIKFVKVFFLMFLLLSHYT